MKNVVPLPPTMLRDPVFIAGLALRIALILLVAPRIQTEWFVPFLDHAIADPSLDPWSVYLNDGGSIQAYPYGPAMLFVHLIGALPGHLLGFTAIGFRLSLLLADFSLLCLLQRVFPQQPRKLLWLYWWSPIVLFATYWNGQTDIVPVALLILALVLLQMHRPMSAGIAAGLALAAKFSMVLAIPFFAIYLWRNKRLRSLLKPFLFGLTIGTLPLLPCLLSNGFRTMVLGTQESARIFDFYLPLGSTLKLYLTPTLYLLSVYAVWRLRRISFDLLVAVIGLSFFLVVLTTPAPPGWYVWLVPFLVAHQLHGDRSAILLTGVLSLLMIGLHLSASPGASIPALGWDLDATISMLSANFDSRATSLLSTMVIATGLILLAQMLRERVARNDYHRIAQHPVTLGISGDSGAGKDTLAQAMIGIFGRQAVSHLSGDDYHVWDRYAPMWKGLTHLNPRANDLQRFNSDALALIDGKAIDFRHYDHSAGRFLSPSKLHGNDVVIVSGLHALRMPRLSKRYDVSIFLDIDERLRRAWKIRRDVHERGHALNTVLEAIERRAADANRYVHPQRAVADLVLRLHPIDGHTAHVDFDVRDEPLKLTALIRNGTYHERLSRILIGICGMHLDMDFVDDTDTVEVSVEGEVSAEDIALAADALVPNLRELLDITPQWESGMTGIMQLIVLLQIEESLKNRTR